MSRTVVAALAAISVSIMTFGDISSASAEDFVWSSDGYNDPANKGRFTAHLTLGVPETDNRQFSALCSPGSSATYALTILGYNTGDLRNGRKVTVQFFQNGQQVYQKPGRVHHGDSEEGVGGVLFRPGVDDHLWTVLSRGNRISYRIRGMERARMTLRGSTRAIRDFRQSCRNIFNASNDGGVVDDSDNEENNVSSARSCNKFQNVKSRNSGIPVTIRFANRTGGQRSVMWLNYEGQPVHYKDLAAGESYSQKTFVGHPWMFTDGPGNCKEVFIPKR